MAEKKKSPDPGAGSGAGETGKDGLLAGKFKDDETGRKALVDAYLSLETKHSEVSERMNKAEKLVSAYVTAQAATPAVKPADKVHTPAVDSKLADRLFEEPEKVMKEMFADNNKMLMKYMAQIINGKQEGQDMHKRFYEKYPDLKDYASIVGIHAVAVDREKPGLPEDSGFAEVADRTRAEIAKIREKGTPPTGEPHVGAGEGGPAKPAGTGEGDEKPLTEEQKVDNFIKERNDLKQKQTLGDGLTGGDSEK